MVEFYCILTIVSYLMFKTHFYLSFTFLLTVLLKCQIAFLKFTSSDNQALVECIPIAAVAVHLKLKS